MDLIIERLESAFALTTDLINSLGESSLLFKLNDLPSNKIGDQVWCIVGARESYFEAIKNNAWYGFSCSLNERFSKSKVLGALQKINSELLFFLKNNNLNEFQLKFLVLLLEHEVQHHGQLIRYVYGNNLKFPKSWKERYTV